jgi:threonine/homoserine/homoserine lactone efflux protein
LEGVVELAAFVGVSVIVIVTPGPDTALTVRNSLLGGRRAGVFTALGVISGQACWTLAASAGIAALLVASEPAFVAVKLAGAAYLVFLGAQALAVALRKDTESGGPSQAASERTGSSRVAYRQGLINDLGNPKMAAFFTSLLPQFAPDGGGTFWVMLGLGLLFGALTFAWLCAYVVAVARAGDWLRRPRVRRAIEGVTGTVLVALGVRVATESRQP